MSQEFWGQTTDPAQHDPSSFRYLVHMDNGIRPTGTLAMTGQRIDSKQAGKKFVDDIQAMQSAEFICTSLIDQTRPDPFYGRVGIILEVPESNVVVAAPDDVSSCDRVNLADAINMFGVQPPEVVLSQTAFYNEIVVTGAGIIPVGIMHISRPGYLGEWRYMGVKPLPEQTKRIAERLALPFVEIETAGF